jgi:putative nucleotidyltransferase with HDIG domain
LNKSGGSQRYSEIVNPDMKDLKRQLKKFRSSPPEGETGRKRVDLLNRLGMTLYRTDPLMSEVYAEEARVLSERMGYKVGEAESNQLLGVAFATRGRYDKGLEFFRVSRDISLGLGDVEKLAATYTNFGTVYSNLGRLNLAIDYHMKALSIFEKNNDSNCIAHSMNCIGVVFRKLGDLDKAEQYYMKAMEIREELEDRPGLALSYNNMGIIAKQRGDLETALEWYDKSLELKRELNDRQGIAVSLGNIGEIHRQREDYPRALEYFEESVFIEQEISDEKNYADSCNKLGDIMIHLGRYDEALEYLQKALRISTDMGAGIVRSISLKNLSLLYENRGDHEKAFGYYREYDVLRREIFSENIARTISRLQVRYETEKSERESELYHLRNVELQKEILERKRVENDLVAQERHLEERVRERTEELQKNVEKLKISMKGIIHTLSRIIELKDPSTSGHQERVAELARMIAAEMGFDEDRVEAVYMIALVHDIGKISIPQEILSRPSSLSHLEREFVQTHSQTGYDILSGVDFPWPVADVILQHQELYNGSGYPGGLEGDQIMIEARIIAVADAFESMTSHRPYRSTPGSERALTEITENSGIKYDPEVVDACRRAVENGGFPITLENPDYGNGI